MGNIYCDINAGLFSTLVKLLNLCSPLMLHFHYPLIQLLELLLLDRKAVLNQNPILPPAFVPNLFKSHTVLFLSSF